MRHPPPTPLADFDKAALVSAFTAELQARLAALSAGGAAAVAGARVDGAHRPENRGERGAVSAQGWLAEGLDRRRAALLADLARLAEVPLDDKAVVGPGALVQTEDEHGETDTFFVLPGAAGERVGGLRLLSPASPLVAALRGRAEGEGAQIPRPAGAAPLTITALR
jgi:transcription elongation GreA/GreB family factor